MTERGGGSDVQGGCRSVATQPGTPDSYHLSGYKWFSSAADGEVALTLAKTPHNARVSCFLVATREDVDGEIQGKSVADTHERRIRPEIRLVTLKHKLGTRQVRPIYYDQPRFSCRRPSWS